MEGEEALECHVCAVGPVEATEEGVHQGGGGGAVVVAEG